MVEGKILSSEGARPDTETRGMLGQRTDSESSRECEAQRQIGFDRLLCRRWDLVPSSRQEAAAA